MKKSAELLVIVTGQALTASFMKVWATNLMIFHTYLTVVMVTL